MIKVIFVILLTILIELQYLLWFDEDGYKKNQHIKQQIAAQQKQNQQLELKNLDLSHDIKMVKNGLDGIESIAREELGMIQQGEKFYLIIQ